MYLKKKMNFKTNMENGANKKHNCEVKGLTIPLLI